jgi:hypothetical protein
MRSIEYFATKLLVSQPDLLGIVEIKRAYEAIASKFRELIAAQTILVFHLHHPSPRYVTKGVCRRIGLGRRTCLA